MLVPIVQMMLVDLILIIVLIVDTLGGKRLRRNRRHLKETKALFQPESEIEHNNTNFQKPLLIEQEITNEPTDIAENRIIDNQPIENTQSVYICTFAF
jgi:hypothetical protein